MKKINFLLILIIFLIAAANNKAEAKTRIKPKNIQKILDDQEKLLKAMLERIQKDKAQQEFEEREISIMAEVIYHENWHTDKEKKTARWTGGVLNNRKNSPDYPDTIEGCAYQKGQYSTTKKFFSEQIPDECYEMAKDIYYNGVPEMPNNVVYQSMNSHLGKGIWKSLNGEYFAYG